MDFIALIVCGQYPDYETEPVTRKNSSEILSHWRNVAQITGLHLSHNRARIQPEGLCETINAYYCTDYFLLSMETNHLYSIPALSKIIEGHVEFLRIVYEIPLRVTYLDDFPDWHLLPNCVVPPYSKKEWPS